MTATGGEATTTLFLEATRNGRHPIGILTSTLDKFINGGTTTEYMTQHVGTYLADKYAKVESTSTREYYRVISPSKAASLEIGDSASLAKPTGLVASSVSYDVQGRQTTEYTVKQFRTYIDGHYAHLVSSLSKVYSDPPIISATPVYDPLASSRLPRINPDRPEEGTIPTQTIGYKPARRLKLDDLFEAEKSADYNDNEIPVRAPRLIAEDASGLLDPSPVKEEKTLPTFTVKSDGELHIPTPEPLNFEAENEIEPTSAHRFQPAAKKTALDSVTYIGFVDFTTTIDDTVVIFRPKKTFSTATRNIFIPKIEPTQTSDRINLFKPSAAVINVPPQLKDGKIEAEEQPRRSEPKIVPSKANDIFNRATSGINPLKSLLAASNARRNNRFSKSSVTSSSSSASAAPSIQPSLPSGLGGRPRITILSRPKPSEPSFVPEVESSNKDVEPNEIVSSIDPDSDVELVYKTLFTTYTYFTTFFRASSTRVKSREEVISNIVTLTNILSPSDLAKLKSSCEVDQTCQFISSTAVPSDFTNGFIGRPNTKSFIDEEPRSTGDNDNKNNYVEDNGVFKTFYTTYTYFTTLFVDGTSSISTRTEVYSNVQSSGVPVARTEAPTILKTAARPISIVKPSIEPARNSRRLEYSSIARGNLNSDLLTTEEKEGSINDDIEEQEVVLENETDVQDLEDRVEPSGSLEDIIQLAPDENQIDADNALEIVKPTSVKTFYTTYTYFTTLFRNGSSYVTSNLETVTNTADATASPILIQPSVTFYTTFTYWTTSIDGENTVITSREETKTDILPATITDQILPTSVGIGIDATESPKITPASEPLLDDSEASNDDVTTSVPELESGEVDTTTLAPSSSVTPSLKSSDIVPKSSSVDASLVSASVADFADLDDDFTLASSALKEDSEETATNDIIENSSADPDAVTPNSRSRLTFTRPSSTFTPVIRPNLFRTRFRPNPRPRSRAKSTTVAIITRSDVTPTLIATPVSSQLQTSSPSFVSSSLKVRNLSSASLLSRVSQSSGIINPSSSVINPSRASSAIVSSSEIQPSESEKEVSEENIIENETEEEEANIPSIISGLRLRRPDPFKARLKERQRQRLQQIRLQANTPASGGNRAPIFISSRTENIRRRPTSSSNEASEEEEEEERPAERPARLSSLRSSSGGGRSESKINLPPAIASQRERARQRINALFRRRQPSFLRPQPALNEGEPLAAEASTRRRKRQVNSNYGGYGVRTRERQSYIRKHRSSSPSAQSQSYSYQSPQSFTAFKNAYTSYPDSYGSSGSSSTYNNNDSYFDDSYSYSSTSGTLSKPKSTSVDARPRLARQPQSSPASTATTRTRSRFSRQRLRGNAGVAATTTTTSRPSFSRFRPRTVSNTRGSTTNRFTSSGRRPSTSIFDYDDYDYDYDLELESSQNSVPDAITVTHRVPVMTQIPVFENGRNALRDILTTSPSLEVIAVTALKSTNIDGSPVIYANVRTETPNVGTQVLTFEALRATETTAIEFTPTRIRGLRTSFSHVVPSTIYNIRPITTSVVQEVDSNALLSSLLLQLLGQQQKPQAQLFQSTPALPAGLLGLGAGLAAPQPAPPATQFITHTNTYVTTLTNVESKILPITFRGREIKTTLVQSKTEVVTATELSTETKINPTATAQGGLGGRATQGGGLGGVLGGGGSPLSTLLPADVQQQLLVAQLQQQLLNQQLLSQVNLDPEGTGLVEQTQIPEQLEQLDLKPSTSVVTIFVSGSTPGDFTRITSTVTLTGDGAGSDENERYKRDLLVNPSPVLPPIDKTQAPLLDPSL